MIAHFLTYLKDKTLIIKIVMMNYQVTSNQDANGPVLNGLESMVMEIITATTIGHDISTVFLSQRD